MRSILFITIFGFCFLGAQKIDGFDSIYLQNLEKNAIKKIDPNSIIIANQNKELDVKKPGDSTTKIPNYIPKNLELYSILVTPHLTEKSIKILNPSVQNPIKVEKLTNEILKKLP